MSDFFRRGKTRIYWVLAIDDPTAPTDDEINGGLRIDPVTNDVEGWGYKTDRIETPRMSSEFTPSIGGEQKADDSSLKIYLDSESNPVRAALPQNAEGFVVFIDYKPTGVVVPGDEVDVYSANVIGRPKERSIGNVAAMWTAEFGQTEIPSEDVTVVAGSS